MHLSTEGVYKYAGAEYTGSLQPALARPGARRPALNPSLFDGLVDIHIAWWSETLIASILHKRSQTNGEEESVYCIIEMKFLSMRPFIELVLFMLCGVCSRVFQW